MIIASYFFLYFPLLLGLRWFMVYDYSYFFLSHAHSRLIVKLVFYDMK